jgi:orotate phosphoribosyltransferase
MVLRLTGHAESGQGAIERPQGTKQMPKATSSEPATPRARLAAIIRERSFRSGVEVKLASGRTSSFYFNLKPTMLNAEGARLIGSLILEKIANDQAELVGGLEMGAVPIAAAVAAMSAVEGRPVGAFFVRKAAKEHGTRSLIEGLASGETLKDKRVVIVEDVTTTGGSAIRAAEIVRAEGAEVLRVVTIVDRQEGADAAFREAGLMLTPILTLGDFT